MIKNTLTSLLYISTLICFSQESFLIKEVKVFDGEDIIENTSVFVKEGKIQKVSEDIDIEEVTVIIDGKGKTLIPALSNAHVHAFNPNSFKEASRAGVLNLFDMAGYEPYQNMLSTRYRDSTNYANFYFTGAPATAPKGHGTQFKYPVKPITNSLDIKEFIETKKELTSNYVKIIVEPTKPTLTDSLVKQLINETHKIKKIAVVHVSRHQDAFTVLDDGADGLTHLWRNGIMPEKEMERLASLKNRFIIPTLITNVKASNYLRNRNPNSTVLTEEELKNEIKRLYDGGMMVLAGTDPPNIQINYGTDLHNELILLYEAGIPTIDVLKSATSNIVTVFKIKNKGYIKETYDADLVLLDGDVFDDITSISKITSVWKNGKQVDLN